ncbi:hypothetical protein HMPREF9019_1245 [Hoylesella timonensis CRIS 5C-B1]|uniref:Uncharacterized protein n=2 Tax=Hoylesella timonensis TaxID=386414 RepID=D1W0V8_9BACT|nr:hypothetical protein HMPREF9019_1245 [Hoylesella timonensis CRIS 5C-B1]
MQFMKIRSLYMIVPVALSSILLTSCKPPFHRTQKGVGTSIEFDLDSIQDVPYSQDTRVSGANCYKDTIVCNEETTSGMIEWANRQQNVYEAKSTQIQHKLLACKLAPNILRGETKLQLQKGIADEIAYWKELEELLRHFNSIVTDIQKIQNGGGSIYGIIRADNQRELSYIRYACLLEDLAVLNTTSPQKSSLKDNLCIDSLYIEMRKCRPSVLTHAIRKNEDLSENDAASRAKYLNEAYSFPVVKRGVGNWLNARAQVANLLSPNYGIAYNNHTIRTLRSLIYLYRGMEQGV